MENISYKDGKVKRGGILGFFKKRYILTLLFLIWLFFTLLWYFDPRNNDPELAYSYTEAFHVILGCDIILFILIAIIKILAEIPKTIGRCKKEFGKKSFEYDDSFSEKLRKVFFYSPASFALLICFLTAIIFGVAACIEPFVFAEGAAGNFAEHLFVIVAAMFAVPIILAMFLGIIAVFFRLFL
ncbi:hypothetical protein J6Z19_05250 [bacterium]|nr:hypothetical protein [bacterium]